jgi:hypothetical protein
LRHDSASARFNPLPPGLVQRGLTLRQAAVLVGLSESGYRKRKRMGDYPGPTLPGKRYDRRLLEAAMDRLSGIQKEGNAPTPLDDWRASRARSDSRN